MNGLRTVLALASSLAAGACARPGEQGAETPPGAVGADRLEVTVDARGRSLALANHQPDTLYYHAYERQFAMVANWRPCVPPLACRTVAPNGRVTVPFDSIRGLDGQASEVIVYWYGLARRADGRVAPDSVRSRIVPIRR